MVQRVFYEHYKGPIPKGKWVLRKCGLKLCVNPVHLQLGDPLEPEVLLSKIGGDRHYSRSHPEKIARGDRAGNSKLKESDIPKIFQLHFQGSSHETLARRFNVSSSAIAWVLKRKTWKHVIISLPNDAGRD
jgi:hypothetical protein